MMTERIVNNHQQNIVASMLQEAESFADNDCLPDARAAYFEALCLQEGIGGFYNAKTAEIYYRIAWAYYESNDFMPALTCFLLCLRISDRLSRTEGSRKATCSSSDRQEGKGAVMVQVLMDDICDVIEDLGIEEEVVNRVFESWALQEDVACLLTHTDLSSQFYPQCSSTILETAKCDLLAALQLLPDAFDMERAIVYTQLAVLSQRQRDVEEALSYNCKTLMILPGWLSHHRHPRLLEAKKMSLSIARDLTPVNRAVTMPVFEAS